MQVFNQINARILTGGLNIFAGIFRNWLFLAVTLFTFGIQMLMVEIGGKVTKTWPLELFQNGICLIIGSGELFWGIFIKYLPTKVFQCFNFEESPMTE
jgi:Ca2+ transporting ATPase